MAWKLTINGTDKTALIHQPAGVSIDWAMNGRSTASFTCLPGLIPEPHDVVIIYAQDGTTPIFGGLVLATGRSVTGLSSASSQHFCQVECGDYGLYADWCVTAADAGSPVPITMKAVLQGIIADYLTRYSVTLDAGQVTGPTLNAFSRPNTRISDVLRELADYTGYVWRIDASKVLKMFVPGTDAAPHDLTDATPHCQDISWADNGQNDVPANTIVLLYGPASPTQSYEEATGDGATHDWTTTIAEVVPTDRVTVDGIEYTISSGAFTWVQGTHTLSVGTAPIPGIGKVLRLYYTVPYPLRVEATTGATPKIEALVTAPDILTPIPAQALANQLLASRSQPAIDLDIATLEHGFLPGQTLTVALTLRGLDVTAVISSVSAQIVTDGHWVYQVKATGSRTHGTVLDAPYRGTALDQWRTLLGGSARGRNVAVGSGGSSVVTLAAPVPLATARNQSVQCGTTPAEAPDYILYEAPGTFGGIVRVECKARQAGVGVTPSLWDVTAGAAAATGSKVTSTTWVSQDISVTITSGHQYYLRVVCDNAAGSAYCVGKLVPS